MLTSWWRHAGLQQLENDDMAVYQLPEDAEDKDFCVKDWHEPVQINLGPNVGDITTRCEPAYLGWVNFISSIKVIKQMKAQGL